MVKSIIPNQNCSNYNFEKNVSKHIKKLNSTGYIVASVNYIRDKYNHISGAIITYKERIIMNNKGDKNICEE